MARLRRDCLITEKIDGTNASIYIGPYISGDAQCIGIQYTENVPLGMWAGSRTRWITPENDNFGFAAWAKANAEELFDLGEGHHFGEWWGSGIQRGYGYKNGERFFSLFNAARWTEHDRPTYQIPNDNPTAEIKSTQNAPACCKVVPILYSGLFDTDIARLVIYDLKQAGSAAAEGYMNPEGIIVYHTAAGVGFKMTIDNDHQPKGVAQ